MSVLYSLLACLGDIGAGFSVFWSIFTVISSVFQIFPAASKLSRVDSSSRRTKIREMEEEEEEIRRNAGGEVGKGGTTRKEDNLQLSFPCCAAILCNIWCVLGILSVF